MLSVRLSTIFTSRWFALLWAVLVILTAIQFVGAGDDDAAKNGQGDDAVALDDLTNDQRQAIAHVLWVWLPQQTIILPSAERAVLFRSCNVIVAYGFYGHQSHSS